MCRQRPLAHKQTWISLHLSINKLHKLCPFTFSFVISSLITIITQTILHTPKFLTDKTSNLLVNLTVSTYSICIINSVTDKTFISILNHWYINFLPTVHYEYDWYSREGCPPPGLGPVWRTAPSSSPSSYQPSTAFPPLQLSGLHHCCWWRQRNTVTCGRTSSLFCSWERWRRQWSSSGAEGYPGLLGLLGAGDCSEPGDCCNQCLPCWTSVRDHPDTSDSHGGVWLPLPLYGKKGRGWRQRWMRVLAPHACWGILILSLLLIFCRASHLQHHLTYSWLSVQQNFVGFVCSQFQSLV